MAILFTETYRLNFETVVPNITTNFLVVAERFNDSANTRALKASSSLRAVVIHASNRTPTEITN